MEKGWNIDSIPFSIFPLRNPQANFKFPDYHHYRQAIVVLRSVMT
ncbi:hypothetical protein ACFPFV_03220 [Salinicoccus siamensis]